MADWDVAIRYHELKATAGLSREDVKKLRKVSAEAVLRKARNILGSVSHPTKSLVSDFEGIPPLAQAVEFDLEESLEQSLRPFEAWFQFHIRREQSLVLCVDTSLSMTGEKLALTAVALAVVMLQFPTDPIAIVAFENDATVIKEASEKISVQMLLERFLDVPAQGYTHLEAGLTEALRMTSMMPRGRSTSVVTLLLTDGKYTAGRDPAFLADRFEKLVVLKMGGDRSSLNLVQELAERGHGMVHEVDDLNILPETMYDVVKQLIRGVNRARI